MQITKSNKKFMQARVIAFFIGIALLSILTSFVMFELKIRKQNHQVEITQSYIQFEDRIQTFLINKANLMKGFSAYIQTFETYEEKEVYDYLQHLIEDDIYYIRNIGIIKDTTILWNYPRQGNEKAIGKDLSKVPGQAESVARIKKTLKYEFNGPIELVQGGTGYIMRVPIIRNKTYWGLASIVLKADKVMELFEAYEKECSIRVAIVDESEGNRLVYGDKSILKQKPVAFSSAFTGGDWTVYVISDSKASDSGMILLYIIAAMGVVLTLWITRKVYRFFQAAEKIKMENNSLNVAVMKDSLTGIFNRKYIDARITEETDRLNRYDGHLSIIYFDLDHFKKVNDTYGHGYGDSVLKEVASTVKHNLRASDIFARWGGEEFAILMPEITLEGAAATAEKLRATVEAIVHPIVGKVTASFGVAEYIRDEYAGSWFQRVDKALYTAKSGGRNRVSTCIGSMEDANVLMRIRWTDEWLSGNESIDLDHKRLLELGNEMIESSYSQTNHDELLHCINEFSNHVIKHFENEEGILEKIDFLDLDEHIAAHRKLTTKMMELKEKAWDNKANSQDLLVFFQNDILLDHLIHEDVRFFPALRG